MSLARIALRISAIEALKHATLVEGNVLDSEIGSLQVDADGTLRTEEDRPFITVFTDAGSTRDMDNSVRSFSLNGATEILFESGIAATMTETDPTTDESRIIGVGIPATDRAFEFYLDLLSRQIGDVLTDPENEWSAIFRGLIVRTVLVERARTSSGAEGVRLAGHQVKLTVDLVADPLKGEPVKPESALGKFFAKAATLDDPVIQTQISAMLTQLSGDPFTWQSMQRRYGMTSGEMDSLLLNPVTGAEADVDIAVVNTPDATPVEH